MKTILNIIWLILCGFWMFLGYMLAGVLLCITIIGIPFGLAAFRIGVYALWPFGQTVVDRRDAGALASVVMFLVNFAWLIPIGRSDDDEGPGLIGMLLVVILGPLAASVIQLAVSRSREYEADASGSQLTGDPLALASALRKLDAGTKQLPLPPEPRLETASHMMIANPFRPGQGLSKMFSTHPPMAERIARLEKMAGPHQ